MSVQGSAGPKLILPYVDGVRALAALFVLAGHTWFQPTNGYYAERWMNRLGLSYGHLAVDAFIVVSGFVIGLPIARSGNEIDSVFGFYRRRVRRIVPPYYAALLLSAGVGAFIANQPSGTVWDHALPVTWVHVVWNLLLLHDMPVNVPGGSISYQLWSIAVEFHIYLLVPLLLLALKKIGRVASVLLAIAASGALHAVWPAADTLFHWYVSLFIMGLIGARVAIERKAWGPRLMVPGLLWLGSTAAAILKVGHHGFEEYMLWFDISTGFGVALLLTSLSFESTHRSLLFRLLSHPWIVGIGGFSYSLYLVHPPLLQLFWMALRRLNDFSPVQTFFLLLASSPLIVGASYLFYVAFERPFMKKRVRPVEPVSVGASAGV